MSNVRDITGEIDARSNRVRGRVDSDGGGPHDPGMEERVKKLEGIAEKTVERLNTLERDIAVIKSNYATKEDLHKELHATTWKIVGAIALLCGAVFWMARNIEPPATPTHVSGATTVAPVATPTQVPAAQK